MNHLSYWGGTLFVITTLVVLPGVVEAQTPDISERMNALQQQVQQLQERVDMLQDRLMQKRLSNTRQETEQTNTVEAESEIRVQEPRGGTERLRREAPQVDEVQPQERERAREERRRERRERQAESSSSESGEQRTSTPDLPDAVPSLSVGDRGPKVRKLQELLATSNRIYPEGEVTGYFGELTKQAVTRLQEELGISPTGRVDRQTFEAVSRLMEEGAGNSDIIPSGFPGPEAIREILERRPSRQGMQEQTSNANSVSRQERRVRESRVDVESLPISEEQKKRLQEITESLGR